MLTTNQKGAVAEAAIAHAALELGIGVLRPLADEPYDLVFDLGRRFLRVQCKWVNRRCSVVLIPCYRARRNADGLLRQYYSRDDVDVFAAYCAELDACYLIPFEAVPARGSIQLRLSPTRNNQDRRVQWAKSFEFGATLIRFGAIAQLGERRAGSAKVAGSSPAGSIPLTCTTSLVRQTQRARRVQRLAVG